MRLFNMFGMPLLKELKFHNLTKLTINKSFFDNDNTITPKLKYIDIKGLSGELLFTLLELRKKKYVFKLNERYYR